MTDDPLPTCLRRPREIALSDTIGCADAREPERPSTVIDRPAPTLAGLLADYFADREDVKRFIDEERSGWETGSDPATEG